MASEGSPDYPAIRLRVSPGEARRCSGGRGEAPPSVGVRGERRAGQQVRRGGGRQAAGGARFQGAGGVRGQALAAGGGRGEETAHLREA